MPKITVHGGPSSFDPHEELPPGTQYVPPELEEVEPAPEADETDQAEVEHQDEGQDPELNRLLGKDE